jgi:sugar/nucleoside kinase (ribokinase family)
MAPAHVTRRRPLDVVVAGLAVVDVIGRPVHISRLPRPGSLHYLDTITLTTGGNVLNCGIDLVKLGFRVGAITRVGDDGLGLYLRSQFSRYGINAEGVIVDRGKQTSATIVCVDPTGERTFYHTRGCLENFRARDVLSCLDLVRKARMFVFGYLGLLPEIRPEMGKLFAAIKRETGVTILLDTGGTPTRSPRLLHNVLPYVDYFLPSFEEAAALTGATTPRAMVEAFRSAGAKGVVGVKLAAHGCFVSWQDRQELIPPPKVRKVVDATGAGDAFVSGFLAGTLTGLEPFGAARIGNAVAASCVTAVGASTVIQPLQSYLSKQ